MLKTENTNSYIPNTSFFIDIIGTKIENYHLQRRIETLNNQNIELNNQNNLLENQLQISYSLTQNEQDSIQLELIYCGLNKCLNKLNGLIKWIEEYDRIK